MQNPTEGNNGTEHNDKFIDTAPARLVLIATSGTNIDVETLKKVRNQFITFLEKSNIHPDHALSQSFSSIAIAIRSREANQKSGLEDIQIVLMHVRLLLGDTTIKIPSNDDMLRHRFVMEHRKDASKSLSRDPIERMCQILSSERIAINDVIEHSGSFMVKLIKLQGRNSLSAVQRRAAEAAIELFQKILHRCTEIAKNETSLQGNITTLRNKLRILLQEQVNTIIMSRKRPKIDLFSECTPANQVDNTSEKTTPSAGSIFTPIQKQNPTEESTTLVPETSNINGAIQPTTLADAKSVRELLERSRVGICALATAVSMPPDVLLHMKQGTQLCSPSNLLMLIQKAGTLPPLGETEKDYTGEVTVTNHPTKKVRVKFTLGQNEPEINKTTLDPHELIFDNNWIQAILHMYRVTIEQVYPCPKETEPNVHAQKLQKLRDIMEGKLQYAHEPLLELRRNIENSCIRLLANKNEEGTPKNNLRRKEDDSNTPEVFVDKEKTLLKLCRKRNLEIQEVFLHVQKKGETLRMDLKSSAAQRRNTNELSTMTIAIFEEILLAKRGCLHKTFQELEVIIRGLMK